jgi:antitoxin MazE
MKVRIKKWGNSASIRVPSALMDAADLSIDQEVDLREENGFLVVDPLRIPHYDLDDLLADITEDDLHPETSTGHAVGNEVW